MQASARKLNSILTGALGKLEKTDPIGAKFRPAAGKWSANEILGHLIDSALNNHQRIVRAQYGAAEDFPGYDQSEWVRVQNYNDIPWPILVNHWKSLNELLGILIENIPAEARRLKCNIGKETSVTLEFVVEDYLRHLMHHLEVIDKQKAVNRP